MIVFLLCILAIVVTGGGAAKANYVGVASIYIVLCTLLISYGFYFITQRETLSIGLPEKCLLVFEGWGLLYVLLSLVGINRVFQADLTYNYSFIPRQAVYFFVFPSIILFRNNTYMNGAEHILRKYGEILFWVLYCAQIICFKQVILTVIAQTLLCWLSLWLDTNQRWRRWIRVAVLLLTPLDGYGELTILLIRMIFLAVYVIPKAWSRAFLCLMAAVVFAIVCVCFIVPATVEENKFSDVNMAWRARTWKDQENVLFNTYMLGAGYGSSYPSKTYSEESIQRGENQYNAGDGYTQEERVFVSAPHNSFMSLTAKTGIVGLVLFLVFLILLFCNLVKHQTLPSKSACFALFAGVMLILFNVGLENPGYLLTFVFLIGMCSREGKKSEQQHKRSLSRIIHVGFE